MTISTEDVVALLRENAGLRARAREAEGALAALRRGDIDTLLVGNDLYMRDGADILTQRLHRHVLVHMRDAVLAFDNDDRIIFMNPAAEQQYGCSLSDVLGHPRSALYRELDHEPDAGMQAGHGAAGNGTAETTTPQPSSPQPQPPHEAGTYDRVSLHILGDGRRMQVRTMNRPLHAADSQVAGQVMIVHRASPHTDPEDAAAAPGAAEAVLREANHRKDEFLATLSHELRNPLAPIRNALHIMQLTHDVAAHTSARGIIERQLQQLVRLVDDLLDVSRISRGKLQLRRESVDVAAALKMAVETSRPAIEGGRHELIVRPPDPGSLLVDADLTRLCQIIANLLNNAAKYTPDGGRIEVDAVADGNDAMITVQDSGVGIAADMLPRIFELFAQVDRSQSRSQGGLGIGLALVKTLVEMHAGTVQALSAGHGRGSRFVVRLPRIAKPPFSAPA